jgi:3-hydroxyacyl-[acyl-carrier-protein] dehydratase
LRPIGRFVVPPDDACLDGHFPGRPTVPGVVVVDEAVTLICGRMHHVSLAEILVGKFAGVVLPGQPVEVSCGEMAAGRVEFACTQLGRTVALGVIRLTVHNL